MSNFEWEFEDYVCERTAHVPAGVEAKSLASLMQASRITCGSGLEHDAEVCLVCPRFVSCTPARDGTSLRIQCWWHRPIEPPRRSTRGSGTMPGEPPRCSSCHSDEDLSAHSGMEDVYFCRSCAEDIDQQIDWEELGAGD